MNISNDPKVSCSQQRHAMRTCQRVFANCLIHHLDCLLHHQYQLILSKLLIDFEVKVHLMDELQQGISSVLEAAWKKQKWIIGYQLKYFYLIRMFHTDYDLVSISHIFYICYIFMPLKGLQLYQKI